MNCFVDCPGDFGRELRLRVVGTRIPEARSTMGHNFSEMAPRENQVKMEETSNGGDLQQLVNAIHDVVGESSVGHRCVSFAPI